MSAVGTRTMMYYTVFIITKRQVPFGYTRTRYPFVQLTFDTHYPSKLSFSPVFVVCGYYFGFDQCSGSPEPIIERVKCIALLVNNSN